MRGIGVALRVSTCTPSAKPRNLSLMPRAETLLLVDDQQAEPVEADTLAGDRVRADHDIDRPVCQPLL